MESMTMFDVCRSNAERTPEATAYVWLNEEESVERAMTFREIYGAAARVATALRERGLAGRHALLMYRPGLDFIIGLLGCFASGVVAVPIPSSASRRSAERWARIAADCAAKAILTDEQTAGSLAKVLSAHPVLSGLAVVATDELGFGVVTVQDQSGNPIDADGVALIQYTSGSTGVPNGVIISHGNVLANQEMISTMFGHSGATVFAGWLPFYHDMGLIGNVLQPLYLGVMAVLMSPDAFIQKPIRWLRAISRFRATTSGAPNFAYDLCTRRVPEEILETIDLSSWEVAFNGSEPVRPETIAAFSRKFKRSGFRHSAFYPCYGLAEATLLVAGGVPGSAPPVLEVEAEALKVNVVKVISGQAQGGACSLVGCGRATPGEEIAIVDPGTCCRLGTETAVGEIWIRGSHVSRGYLNQPEVSAKMFSARTSSGEGPYLRSGDLGFMQDGELYITGRIKELIIVNGRNYYPHDIEKSLQGLHWAFRADSTAAFPIEMDGTTKVGLIQEIDRKFNRVIDLSDVAVVEEMQRSVRRVIADEHGLAIHGCVFVSHGGIPMTSSGKIRRRACAEIYSDYQQRGRAVGIRVEA
jgi:acyl-CoA synthetase (AMP-forming)/AMP-acid ligase II